MSLLSILGLKSTEKNRVKDESAEFLEFFDFSPQPHLLQDPYYQAEILWRLVLLARKLKKTAERKVSDPHSYPGAYRRLSHEYRDAVHLAKHFCRDLSEIPLHWAALEKYIRERAARGSKSHRVFTEPLALN